MKTKLLFVTFALLVLTSSAAADCTCRCVDGGMQPLCSNAIEVPPVCPPVVCPIVTPSIAPIVTPMVPPVGTSQCRQAQVCNQLGRCEWQLVCR